MDPLRLWNRLGGVLLAVGTRRDWLVCGHCCAERTALGGRRNGIYHPTLRSFFGRLGRCRIQPGRVPPGYFVAAGLLVLYGLAFCVLVPESRLWEAMGRM